MNKFQANSAGSRWWMRAGVAVAMVTSASAVSAASALAQGPGSAPASVQASRSTSDWKPGEIHFDQCDTHKEHGQGEAPIPTGARLGDEHRRPSVHCVSLNNNNVAANKNTTIDKNSNTIVLNLVVQVEDIDPAKHHHHRHHG